jgi:hypothetical protein
MWLVQHIEGLTADETQTQLRDSSREIVRDCSPLATGAYN